MPHVIVKLWPGKSERQKTRLAEAHHQGRDGRPGLRGGVRLGRDGGGQPRDWAEKVYKPDIVSKPEQLYKKPGYDLSELP